MSEIENASWLSQDQTAKWLPEGFPHNMQPAPVWTFKPVRGGALKVPIQAEIDIDPDSFAIVTADIVVNADALVDRTASPDGDLSRVYPIGELGTRFTVPYFQRDTLTVPNDLTKLQIGQATLRLMYAYFKKICTGAGSGSPGDFDGLLAASNLETSQTVLVGATKDSLGNLTLDQLYYAVSLVTAGPGRPNMIMSHSLAQRMYFKLCDAAGKEIPRMAWDWIDPVKGYMRGEVPTLMGIPWFVNDLAPVQINTSERPYADIFFLLHGDDEDGKGGRGVVGIIPQERVGNMFVMRKNEAGGSTGSEVPVDVTWPVGLAVGSRKALSVVRFFELDVPPYEIPPG